MKTKIIFIATLLFIIPVVFGSPYLTYIHNPVVPETEVWDLSSAYQTSLQTGAAVYNYPITMPPGTNGLVPFLDLNYNSHATNSMPSIVGTAWSISDNYIQRDINYTISNTSNDKFKLFLQGQSYDLIYTNNSRYHTKIESYLYIENKSGGDNILGDYWIVKTKN